MNIQGSIYRRLMAVELKSQKQWQEWSRERRPANIPSNPQKTYADKGWLSMADWLGYDKDKFLEFEQARSIVWELELKSAEEWREWSKERRPPNIPSDPYKTYKGKGWVSYPDWLGYDKDKFLPFEEARAVVREAGLKNTEQWWAWSREHSPAYVPAAPHRTYAGKGWVSYPDWMGYSKRDTR